MKRTNLCQEVTMHIVKACCLFFALSLPAWGYLPMPQQLLLGAHLLNQDIKKVQTDENGSLNTFRPKPFVSAELIFDITQQFKWRPSLGLGLPHEGRDPNIKRWSFYTFFPASYAWENWNFFLGPGFFFTRLSSDGGTAELDNGVGTDRFFLPEVSSTSANLIWDAAVSYQFHPQLSARLDVFVTQLMDSERRSFSNSISIHYHFNQLFEGL